MNRFLTCLIVVCASCTCRSGVNSVQNGFRVAEPRAIDFGRVLEGETVVLPLTLVATSRAAVTVRASTAAPFFVPPSVDIEGGSQVEVRVSFRAGKAAAMGELLLRAGEQEERVPITGVGVRPPVCLSSAPCRESNYSVIDDLCIETVSPDNELCEPTSVCLEQGRCRSGECFGVARTCDDADQCTVDVCAMTAGCLHTPRLCPAPANPCMLAACDSESGCTETQAPDLSPCGPLDCITIRACVSGICRTLPTPEGTPCQQPIACLGPGFCHEQRCELADAGPWLPAFTAKLPGVPRGERPALLASASGLFLEVCGVPRDGGVSATDAGVTCALSSYTKTGFERFTRGFDDDLQRHLVHVSPAAVVMMSDAGIEWRSTATGAVVNLLPFTTSVGRIAARSNGTVVVSAGSALIEWSDAGANVFAQAGDVSLIALEQDDTLLGFQASANTLFRYVDGGLTVMAVTDGGALASSLVTANGITLIGATHATRRLADGGVTIIALDWPEADAGLKVDDRAVLVGQGVATVFYRRCETLLSSCLDADKPMYLRAFDARTGAVRFEEQVLPAGPLAHFEEAALLGSGFVGAAVFVHGQVAPDAGFAREANAFLEIIVEGKDMVLCPLGNTLVEVRGAALSSGRLFVLDDQRDGGAVMHAYELNALPLSSTEWSQANGIGATRRAGP